MIFRSFARDYGLNTVNLLRLIAASAVVAIFVGFTTVSAIEDSNTQVITPECQAMSSGASSALKNRLGLTRDFYQETEKSMKAAVNMSCISAMSLLNFDLSSLIPDFNVFSMLLQAAIDRFVKIITDKVCDALGSIVGDWNQIIGSINDSLDIVSAVERWGNGVPQEFDFGGGGSFGSNKPVRPIDLIGAGGSTGQPDFTLESIPKPPDEELDDKYRELKELCWAATRDYGYLYPSDTVGNNYETRAAYSKAKNACELAITYWRIYSPNYRDDKGTTPAERNDVIRKYENLLKACKAAKAKVPMVYWNYQADSVRALQREADRVCAISSDFFNQNNLGQYYSDGNISVMY